MNHEAHRTSLEAARAKLGAALEAAREAADHIYDAVEALEALNGRRVNLTRSQTLLAYYNGTMHTTLLLRSTLDRLARVDDGWPLRVEE